MKIIFLDFDGVIVSAESLKIASGIQAPGDPKCIAQLNRIIAATDARIVVTSTWRLHFSVRELQDLLSAWGVFGIVQDRTDNLNLPRSEEIGDWLSTGIVEKFVILDDIDQMAEFQNRLVWTCFPDGLTASHADRAIALLQ